MSENLFPGVNLEGTGLENLDLSAIYGSDLPGGNPADAANQAQDPQESVDPAPSRQDAEPGAQDGHEGTPQDGGPQNQGGNPEWNPDGPGDVRVALRQARDSERAANAQVQQLQGLLAQQGQQIAQLLESLRPQQQTPAEPEVDPLDPTAYNALNRRLDQLDQRQTTSQVAMRAQITEDMARLTLPDYDGAASFVQALGPVINYQAILASPNPALAQYSLAKRMGWQPRQEQGARTPQPAATQQQQVPDIQPTQPQGPRGIGKLPTAAQNQTERKGNPAAIGSDQLASMDPGARQDWYLSSLAAAGFGGMP